MDCLRSFRSTLCNPKVMTRTRPETQIKHDTSFHCPDNRYHPRRAALWAMPLRLSVRTLLYMDLFTVSIRLHRLWTSRCIGVTVLPFVRNLSLYVFSSSFLLNPNPHVFYCLFSQNHGPSPPFRVLVAHTKVTFMARRHQVEAVRACREFVQHIPGKGKCLLFVSSFARSISCLLFFHARADRYIILTQIGLR